MDALSRLKLPLLAAAQTFACLIISTAIAADPVLDDPVQVDRVAPTIPGGKVLLMPLTASDADGDPLIYTVKSSNPRIFARVKTGNPFLKFSVDHAAGAVGDPAYSGDLIFMLLQDWTPVTARFIGGFAQSGYYDGTVFHRMTDLAGGVGSPSFIFQGGDPLGPTANAGRGGPGMTGNDPDTAWKFQNELQPALLFSGRGQLAMANSGTFTSPRLVGGNVVSPDYSDSNGSQFFITDAQPRFLDFNHTVFAQLVRGWDLLPKLKATGREFRVANDPNEPVPSKPIIPVTLVGGAVQPTSGPGQTDAVLVLSATAVGTAVITVTVDDGRGGKATKIFTATCVKDTTNTPTIFSPVPSQITAKDRDSIFPINVTDLEFDFVDPQHKLLLNGATNASLIVTGGRTVGVRPKIGYEGPLRVGLDAFVYNMGAQKFSAAGLDSTFAAIGVGDRIIDAEAITIHGAPGVAFSGVVGKFRDVDPAALPADSTASINWGDGTPLEVATVARDTSSAAIGVMTLSGTHTYPKAGLYPVVIEVSGNKGARLAVRSQALITTAALQAEGRDLDVVGSKLVNQVVATFTDTASTGNPADYLATLDWGDGSLSRVTPLRIGGGAFTIRGTHTYKDSERYSIRVRVHRKAEATDVNDAVTFSLASVRFTSPPHLPPFPQPRVTIAWLPVTGPTITKTFSGAPGATQQVQLAGNFVILNSGSRALGGSTFRFWLSDDNVLQTAQDRKLTVRLNGLATFVPQLFLNGFAAGASTGTVGLTVALPKGVSGGRKFLITEVAYGDALTNAQAIEKSFALGPIDPAIVSTPSSGLVTTEAGGTATFNVVLDTAPTADVTIPLQSSDTTEGTVSPAQLVFTSLNWNIPQTVTVTGVDDTTKDGNLSYTIRLNSVTSTDTLYGGAGVGDPPLNPPDVNVRNTDNEP